MDSITTVPLVMTGVTCYGRITTVPLVMTGVTCYGQYHNSATRHDRSDVLWTISQQCHSS
jgi:hypothetical protein